jgi:hypothetical protein
VVDEAGTGFVTTEGCDAGLEMIKPKPEFIMVPTEGLLSQVFSWAVGLAHVVFNFPPAYTDSMGTSLHDTISTPRGHLFTRSKAPLIAMRTCGRRLLFARFPAHVRFETPVCEDFLTKDFHLVGFMYI